MKKFLSLSMYPWDFKKDEDFIKLHRSVKVDIGLWLNDDGSGIDAKILIENFIKDHPEESSFDEIKIPHYALYVLFKAFKIYEEEIEKHLKLDEDAEAVLDYYNKIIFNK